MFIFKRLWNKWKLIAVKLTFQQLITWKSLGKIVWIKFISMERESKKWLIEGCLKLFCLWAIEKWN